MKNSEREKLQDCLLLIQSATTILSGMKETMIPKVGELKKCFIDADQTLTKLLRS